MEYNGRKRTNQIYKDWWKSNNIDEPYDFFKLIFTDSYINLIVINSNEYKEKKKKKYNENMMI